MNTQIRFGERMSIRGGRWAYFEGSAYLLGVRFFFVAGAFSVALASWSKVGLVRLDVRCGSVVFVGDNGGSECLNWARWDAKSVVDGGALDNS